MSEQGTQQDAGTLAEPEMPEHVAPGDSGHADHHNLLADDAVWFKGNIDGLHRAWEQVADNPTIKGLTTALAETTGRLQVTNDALTEANGKIGHLTERVDLLNTQVADLTTRLETLESK